MPDIIPQTHKRGKNLKAPFPYFGGKSKVASLVWERLGDPANFVEPFFGSGAVLLSRPTEPKVETVNDLSGFICNFWRAVKHDPDAVADFADGPVNETDLHARHRWLVFSKKSRAALARVKADPEYFHPKIAGWWCHGACCWIGSGWCDDRHRNVTAEIRPGLSECGGRGVHKVLTEQLPHMDAATSGVHRLTPSQLPSTGSCDGVNRVVEQVPRRQAGHNQGLNSGGRIQLADAYSRGRGVNGNDSASTCEHRRLWLTDWMMQLADRLRAVRVCCGDWSRVCNSPSTMTRLGLAGVFLDPPYRKTVGGKKNRADSLYVNDNSQDVDKLCDGVQEWCLKWGDNPEVRIALCGYEGEYDLPGWTVQEWKAVGGYGNQSGKVNENAARERIWFSPHCVQPEPDRQFRMFDDEER